MDNQNVNNRQFSVSTSIISMFDENNNQLRLAGLESGMSIGIWVPQIAPDGKMSYPREARFQFMISTDTVGSLDWILKNRVIPDWQAGKDFKYGVPLNRNMTAVLDIIGVNEEVYLKISFNIDENRRAERVQDFKFVNTNMLKGYDSTTGEFEIEKIPAQFALFMEVIGAYTAVAYCAGHGSRVANKFTISNMYNYLQAIATKIGAAVNTGYTQYNNSQSNYNSQQSSGGYNGQMQEVESINKLLE